MRTKVWWVKPVYLSVFAAPLTPYFACGRSWTTTLGVDPLRGAGFMVKAGPVGVSLGLLSVWLQRLVIPKSSKRSMRGIWSTDPSNCTTSEDEDLAEL